MTADADPLLSFLAVLTELTLIQRNVSTLYSSVRKLSEVMHTHTHSESEAAECPEQSVESMERLLKTLENKNDSKSIRFP